MEKLKSPDTKIEYLNIKGAKTVVFVISNDITRDLFQGTITRVQIIYVPEHNVLMKNIQVLQDDCGDIKPYKHQYQVLGRDVVFPDLDRLYSLTLK